MIARIAIAAVIAAGLSIGNTAACAQQGGMLGELPKQQLPAHGCAAYLWAKAPKATLTAMAGADPALLRVNLDGVVRDFALAEQAGDAGLGFDKHAVYRDADATITLDMTVEIQADLAQGGIVSSGSLTVERPGKDILVIPVGGLIGCAQTAQGGM